MHSWPQQLPVVQVRVARPTDRLAEGHDGYDGTQHQHGSPCPAPTRDNLLVFYMPDRAALEAVVEPLGAMGYPPVEPENPYWARRGVTLEDPDGWRVVLQNTSGI